MVKITSIQLDEKVRNMLSDLKNGSESYNDVILRLLGTKEDEKEDENEYY